MEDFYQKPPDYESVCSAMQELLKRHKTLKMFPVGKSVLGRDINALCIGDPAGAVMFVGAIHGLEWLTCMLLLRFCDELMYAMASGECHSEIDARIAFRERSLVIIPCLNPDGVEIALHGKAGAGDHGDEVERLCDGNYNLWQANVRGVDLNHNFDAGWEILRRMEIDEGFIGPGPTRYGGISPESEPETRAVATFCLTRRPRSLYSFHSQGEEIYYCYGKHTPAHSRIIAQILAFSSGYSVADPTGLASHGGLKDWFIEQFYRPGFTIEIGLGKNPLGLEQLDGIYKKISEMLIIAALL